MRYRYKAAKVKARQRNIVKTFFVEILAENFSTKIVIKFILTHFHEGFLLLSVQALLKTLFRKTGYIDHLTIPVFHKTLFLLLSSTSGFKGPSGDTASCKPNLSFSLSMLPPHTHNVAECYSTVLHFRASLRKKH